MKKIGKFLSGNRDFLLAKWKNLVNFVLLKKA